MPGGDRTGPEGRGPMTGRRLGYCNTDSEPWFQSGRGFGRRRGAGFGRGFGRGQGYGRIVSINETADQRSASGRGSDDRIEDLKDRIRYLEEELQRAKDRLKEDP